MNLKFWLKRIVTTSAILALCAWMVPAALAAETSTKVDPKIVQVVDPNFPLALDDKGNIWSMAFHAISVKDGFHPIPMVKVNGLDKVVSISDSSNHLALREDGTVWTIERSKPANIHEHESAVLGDQIPHLEHIVKVDVIGSVGIAIDKEGKVWIFETAPRLLRNDPTFTLNYEPILLNGLDHIKDMSFGTIGVSFLKDDGSVWTIDYPKPSANSSLYNTIQSTMPVQMENLTDIAKLGVDLALKKDGTVWVWGSGILAKSKDDATDYAVAPFQVAELSDIVDFSNGGEHALFVKKDGTVWGWGYFVKNWEELGKEPPKVWKDISQLDGLKDVASVSISTLSYGLTTDAAVKKDGTLWIWGANFFDEFNPNPLQVDFRLNLN